MTTKEQILKVKIQNFILYVEKIFGKNNNLYSKANTYLTDINSFLSDVIAISKYIKKEGDNDEVILKFLEINGVTKKIENEELKKINRYLQMFIKILE